MSPVERSPGHATRAMLVSFSLIALLILLLWGVSAFLTHRHNSQQPDGTVGGVWAAGPAAHLAEEIHDNHRPIFYRDVTGSGRRPIVLSHTGDDPKTGWHAFDALVPDAPKDCVWNWETGRRRFTASCDPSRHLDLAGTGVPQYPVNVTDGKLKVNFTTPVGATGSG